MRRVRLAGEEGIALTAAICSLALMITLSGIALNQAIAALRQSSHQAHVKRALQAADAAIDAATFRVQRADLPSTLKIDPLNPVPVVSQSCVVATGNVAGMDLVDLDPLTPAAPNGDKWCPETGSEPTDSGATFSYRMSQLLRAGAGSCGSTGLINLDRDVVGIGRSGGVVRRVKSRMKAQIALLSGAAVQSSSSDAPLTMSGSARVLGDAHTNEDTPGAIAGSDTNVISGSAVVRDPGTVTGVVPAGGTGKACQRFTLPDVEQGNVRTVNDNDARIDRCVEAATMLVVSCTQPVLGTTGGVSYDAPKRSLRVWGNGRALLTGAKYSFCSVRVENQGILAIPNSTPVTRLFIDDPDNCRDPATGSPYADAGTIKVDGSARLVNCHPQTAPQSLQLYASGSRTRPTTQTLVGAAVLTGTLRSTLCGLNLPVVGEPMTIVAPHSTLELGGSTAIAGQVAAEVVQMSGLAAVNPVNALANLNQFGSNPTLPLYKAMKYVECTGRDFGELPPADPAQGC